MTTDTYYADVALLLHMDGADASTTFTDNSPTPKTPASVNGNSQIRTDKSKWGGASGRFDGTGDYIEYAHSTGFNVGGSPWTVECWFNSASLTSPGTTQYIARCAPDGDFSTSGWTLGFRQSSGTTRVMFYAATGAGEVGNFGTTAIAADTWYHLAATYDGSTVRVFLNGALEVTASGTPANGTSPLRIGGDNVYSTRHFNGHIDDFRITKGVARYTSAFSVPIEAFPDEGPAFVWEGYASAPSMLGAPAVLGINDFSGQLGDAVTLFVMDLLTPGGVVRVPISSWQATLQTAVKNYVQCVIPACADYVDSINAATEFVIYRRAELPTGDAIEYEMARAPLEIAQYNRGPQRYTCVISGYSDGFAEDEDPSELNDRTLTGIRSTASGTGLRVRCAVDWLLRPGQRAYADGVPFVVDYINYFCTDFDAYMDAGERT